MARTFPGMRWRRIFARGQEIAGKLEIKMPPGAVARAAQWFGVV